MAGFFVKPRTLGPNMIKRSTPRPVHDRPPFVTCPNGHVARLPSVASAVLLVDVLGAHDVAQARRKQAPEDKRATARVVACWGVVLGATWSAPGHDLDPRTPWRDVESADLETWGDEVAAEMLANGWTLETLGAAFLAVANALLDLIKPPGPEVKARADFSDPHEGPTNG